MLDVNIKQYANYQDVYSIEERKSSFYFDISKLIFTLWSRYMVPKLTEEFSMNLLNLPSFRIIVKFYEIQVIYFSILIKTK